MSWTSTYEAVEVGDTALHWMIAETAAAMGGEPALIDGSTGRTVSYATLASRVERRSYSQGSVYVRAHYAAHGAVVRGDGIVVGGTNRR